MKDIRFFFMFNENLILKKNSTPYPIYIGNDRRKVICLLRVSEGSLSEFGRDFRFIRDFIFTFDWVLTFKEDFAQIEESKNIYSSCPIY